jgi:hypothetical protein
MPINFAISKEDLLRGRSGKPGWYTLHINDISEGPGKNDPQSMTITIDMKITAGPDPSVIGAPVRHYLSEKAPGMAVTFIEAATGRQIPESGFTGDLERVKGRDVKAMLEFDVKFKTWKASDFAPVAGKLEKGVAV